MWMVHYDISARLVRYLDTVHTDLHHLNRIRVVRQQHGQCSWNAPPQSARCSGSGLLVSFPLMPLWHQIPLPVRSRQIWSVNKLPQLNSHSRQQEHCKRWFAGHQRGFDVHRSRPRSGMGRFSWAAAEWSMLAPSSSPYHANITQEKRREALPMRTRRRCKFFFFVIKS